MLGFKDPTVVNRPVHSRVFYPLEPLVSGSNGDSLLIQTVQSFAITEHVHLGAGGSF